MGLEIVSSTIVKCEAKYGAGIHFDKSNSEVLMKGLNVSYCFSTNGNGGGLYLEGTGGGNEHVTILETTFHANRASGFGGAISADRSNRYLTIAGCNITQNFAQLSGIDSLIFVVLILLLVGVTIAYSRIF